MGDRIMVPNGAPPVMNLAQPLNDVQLVALVAAHRPDVTPLDAVRWAAEIVSEAVSIQPWMVEKIRLRAKMMEMTD